MKGNLIRLSQHYVTALRKHLKQGRQASLESARGLGSQALSGRLQTLDLIKLHEHTLVTEVLPGYPAIFFAVAITPLESKQRSAREEERKTISRELHDIIAQTLTGINIRRAPLKIEAARNGCWKNRCTSCIGSRANYARRCWNTFRSARIKACS